jgi:predicted dehydrogenase
MDIGCYVISFPRFIFGKEPDRVVGMIQRDPVLKTDCLTSGMLDFSDGKIASFTCSTQLDRYQRTQILGTHGTIEIEIPVNTPSDKSTRIWITANGKTEEISFPAVDQYQLEIEAFAKAIQNNEAVPTNFEDALNNMKVIDAVVKSAETDGWCTL